MYLGVVRAYCRRHDVARALGVVADMEGKGRLADAKVSLSLLRACAIPKPPFPREADAVWTRIEVRDGPQLCK